MPPSDLTPEQLSRLRLLDEEHRYACGVYHELLELKAPAAQRHKAEQACSTAWKAKEDFVRGLYQ